ncbi:MAG TPA: putative zinc-binding metallopeptidase [Casimicrobiaceae bacterium]|nr:putative zinc-binding metallopeptidase [Casimicrobiaceae bacterium]
MNAFECTCGQPLFFHNTRCLNCGRDVAYDPDERRLGALVAGDYGTYTFDSDDRSPPRSFRLCGYRDLAAKCNWLIASESPHTACLACRLTRIVPDLSRTGNYARVGEIETAKRRVLLGLMSFGLPVVPRSDDEQYGLAFDFLESLPDSSPIMTGHSNGVITINVAEADSDYREKHRNALHEPYRTLIGHLRHELGHYYWDRLIEGTEWLPKFRALFGDERADYPAALETHYANGPAPNWPDHFVSSYASSHPWEDWAESFAHYLHLRSTLQTVGSYNLDISHARLPITPYDRDVLYCSEPVDEGTAFLGWINAWLVLTGVLNETARSMGQPDLYPFVLNRSVVTKLHFVQCVISQLDLGRIDAPPATLAVAA